MKLTREDNPASLARYEHLKPARGRTKRCHHVCPGTSRSCGREEAHRGPHASFGALRRLVAVWDGAGARAVGAQTVAREPKPKKPVGLRSGPPPSPLQNFREFVSLAFGSAEELAWAVFFLIFVAFAIGGLLLIYLG